MGFSPHGIRYSAHRPVVMGRRGMVAASHPLASQAGVRILQKGGNAVDASVAVAAALNVVEPLMSGIGGDGFIMVYMRADDTVKVVNGTGPAPYAATRDRYLPDGIPLKGILSTSVPGTAAELDGSSRTVRPAVSFGSAGTGHRVGGGGVSRQSHRCRCYRRRRVAV